MSHQTEHQTGLLLFPDDSNNDNKNHDVIAPPTTTTTTSSSSNDSLRLPPAVIKALRSLRDNNPSLQRKLNHGIIDNNDNDALNDEMLSYWNRHQEIVILSPSSTAADNNSSLTSADNNNKSTCSGINLGGLMVRLVNVIPFFQTIEDEKLSSLVTTLNFGGTDIPMDNLLQGVKLLSDDRRMVITGLYLGGCGIACQKDGITYLSQTLELLPNLQTLDLRYNDLQGNDMINHLQHVLITTSNLQTLHLEGNSIKCNGATAIGNVLASPNSTIQELYLGANQIKSMGIKFLAEDGLRYNTYLKKLYLEGNSIGDEGAFALRDVLLEQSTRQTKVLEHLYVDNNGLGKEAAMSLGRAVNSEAMIDGSLLDG